MTVGCHVPGTEDLLGSKRGKAAEAEDPLILQDLMKQMEGGAVG